MEMTYTGYKIDRPGHAGFQYASRSFTQVAYYWMQEMLFHQKLKKTVKIKKNSN